MKVERWKGLLTPVLQIRSTCRQWRYDNYDNINCYSACLPLRAFESNMDSDHFQTLGHSHVDGRKKPGSLRPTKCSGCGWVTLEHTRPVGPIEINQVTEWDETPTLASGVRQSCVWGSALAQQMLALAEVCHLRWREGKVGKRWWFTMTILKQWKNPNTLNQTEFKLL